MIKIAFEGQGVALQQFSAILAPTARGGRQSKPETSASEKCLTDLSNSSSSASSSSSSSSFASSSLTSSASYASASTLSSASLRWDKRSSSSSAGVDELFSTPGGGSISPFTSEDEPSVCPAGASSSSSPGRRDLVPSPLGNDLPSRRAQGRLLTLTLNQADPENEHEYDIDEDDLPIAHPVRNRRFERCFAAAVTMLHLRARQIRVHWRLKRFGFHCMLRRGIDVGLKRYALLYSCNGLKNFWMKAHSIDKDVKIDISLHAIRNAAAYTSAIAILCRLHATPRTTVFRKIYLSYELARQCSHAP